MRTQNALSIRTIIVAGGLLLQLTFLGLHSHAAPGDLDLSFDSVPPTGTSVGPVQSIIFQSDGQVLIAGATIARADPDGSRDTSFTFTQNPNMGISHILALALQPDGKVVVGHLSGIARLNSDGSHDTNFNAPLVLGDFLISAPVRATAVEPDGKILLGGDFRFVNGEIRSSIARLNSDGSLDSTFNPDTSGNQFSSVFSIILQPDGKVVLGGQYMTAWNDSVARLNSDGSLDDANFFSARPFKTVRAVALQPDGKLIVGGGSSGGIVRLNSNGSLDDSFNRGTGTDRGVFSVALQPDGKVLVGGDFSTFDGTNRSRIARVNADGTLDAGFDPGQGSAAIDEMVFAIALQSDGKALVGGNFRVIDGVAQPYLARLYTADAGPALNISSANESVIVSWPMNGSNFQLQETANPAISSSWESVTQLALTNGNQVFVSVPSTNGQKFFRLKSE